MSVLLLSGCIPVDIGKTIYFQPDGSGSMDVDISTPSSYFAVDAFQSAIEQLPSWAKPRTYTREYAVHLVMNFEFDDCDELNQRVKELSKKLELPCVERYEFEARKSDRLLKREYVFTGQIAPQESHSSLDMPPDITTKYNVYLPGRVTDANSPMGTEASWQMRGFTRASLHARSVESIQLNPTLSLNLGAYTSRAKLEVSIDEETLHANPWAKQDWEAYKDKMQQDLAFAKYREVSREIEDEGGKAKFVGLEFSTSFKDPAAVLRKLGLKSSGGGAGLKAMCKKRGIFQPAYWWSIQIPATSGTSLEGIFDYGTVKVKVPGKVLESNSTERDRKDPQILIWYQSLNTDSVVDFTYQRNAWELIIPASLLVVIFIFTVAIIIRNKLRKTARKPEIPEPSSESEQG